MGLSDRLAELEARIAALESSARTAPRTSGDWWLLEHLLADEPERDGIGGSVAYGGVLRSERNGERYVWQIESAAADLFDLDAQRAATVLAALGSPVRVALLRRMLLGDSTLAELQESCGLRTSGQVHHHLRELRAAGLVRTARNSFAVVPERAIPILIMLIAAAGPSGGVVPKEES